jgi:hypothetical protein
MAAGFANVEWRAVNDNVHTAGKEDYGKRK